MRTLTDVYYTECNKIFRNATNQSDLMLRAVQEYCQKKERSRILSIGSGTGLFEIPMLRLLIDEGVHIPEFVGIDINEHACNIVKKSLQAEFGAALKFKVVNRSFQEFTSETRFDMTLYNHVFEYLGDHHLKWIRKSLKLLSDYGNVLIFSPNRGGINKIYKETMKGLKGFEPFFADDIERILTDNLIEFSTEKIIAECDISLLQEPNDHPGKLMLLSFLAQVDCRTITNEKKNEYANYYKTLRYANTNTIPHPTTLFIL